MNDFDMGVIVRIVVRVMILFIGIFGVYVVMYGYFILGGGF